MLSYIVMFMLGILYTIVFIGLNKKGMSNPEIGVVLGAIFVMGHGLEAVIIFDGKAPIINPSIIFMFSLVLSFLLFAPSMLYSFNHYILDNKGKQ